jgi:uncharacterized membrane protein YdfJ with MMPL/SSD domain
VPDVTRVAHLAEAAQAPGLQVDIGGSAVENALRPLVGISAAVGVVLRIGYISGLGIAAAITVLFTVAAATTLLPALLGFLGMRVLSRKERRRLAAAGPASGGHIRLVAAAVLLDAFLLRTLLVPALMHLSGRANWWLPGWLDRTLPHLSIEPAAEPAPTPGPAHTREVIHPATAR